jgi:hypothetical protein
MIKNTILGKILQSVKQEFEMKISANERMNEAVEKVVDYLYENEEKHFLESNVILENRRVEFMATLKEHIFYSFIVMKCKGDNSLIEEQLEEYWEDYAQTDEEEEE